MANRGRPTKLDPRIHEKICDAIRAGNYIETAAAFAGIQKSTLYDWMKRGERAVQESEKSGRKVPKKEQPFVEFSYAVEKALAQAEMEDVQRITDAARSDWKAAAWRLERKFQDKWGRKHQQVISEEERQLRLLEVQKAQLDLERLRIELGNVSGANAEDAHTQISSYTNALKGELANIYPPQNEDEEEGGGDHGSD